jgi:hypothetical protein
LPAERLLVKYTKQRNAFSQNLKNAERQDTFVSSSCCVDQLFLALGAQFPALVYEDAFNLEEINCSHFDDSVLKE